MGRSVVKKSEGLKYLDVSDPVIARLFYDGGHIIGRHVAAISRHMSEVVKFELIFESTYILKREIRNLNLKN